MLPAMKVPFSSQFYTVTDILRTLANFNILPDWMSFTYFRQKVLGVNSFDDLAKFNPMNLVTNTTNSSGSTNSTNKRFLAGTVNIETSDNGDGPNLEYIGIESDSITENIGSLGDMLIATILVSILI
jgi:hypothetical protein